MKKYLLLVLCLVSSVGFAARVVCPETVTCTIVYNGSICHPNPEFGSKWKQMGDFEGGQTGVYHFFYAGITDGGVGKCSYRGITEYADAPLISTVWLATDKGAFTQKWNAAGNCYSTDPWECPFSDVKKTDG